MTGDTGLAGWTLVTVWAIAEVGAIAAGAGGPARAARATGRGMGVKLWNAVMACQDVNDRDSASTATGAAWTADATRAARRRQEIDGVSNSPTGAFRCTCTAGAAGATATADTARGA